MITLRKAAAEILENWKSLLAIKKMVYSDALDKNLQVIVSREIVTIQDCIKDLEGILNDARVL